MPSLTWHKTLRDMEINLEHMLHCSVLFSVPLKFNMIYNSRWSCSNASDSDWTKIAETCVRGEHRFRTQGSCFPLMGQWDQRWWLASRTNAGLHHADKRSISATLPHMDLGWGHHAPTPTAPVHVLPRFLQPSWKLGEFPDILPVKSFPSWFLYPELLSITGHNIPWVKQADLSDFQVIRVLFPGQRWVVP